MFIGTLSVTLALGARVTQGVYHFKFVELNGGFLYKERIHIRHKEAYI